MAGTADSCVRFIFVSDLVLQKVLLGILWSKVSKQVIHISPKV